MDYLPTQKAPWTEGRAQAALGISVNLGNSGIPPVLPLQGGDHGYRLPVETTRGRVHRTGSAEVGRVLHPPSSLTSQSSTENAPPCSPRADCWPETPPPPGVSRDPADQLQGAKWAVPASHRSRRP